MKRLFFILIIAISATFMAGAVVLPQLNREKPDMEKIKRDINDRTSPYYYPRLMEEFMRNDTLMKIDKYRHLYLGYMFQEDYTPYRSRESKMRFALREKDQHQLTRQECDSVIADAEAGLADNPFDLRRMTLLIAALNEKGKTNLAKIWQYKLDYLLMAIISTGTGLDEENAWYVIQPEHENVLLNAMGFVADNHVFYEPYYEYITGKDSGGTKCGYYFNIATILEEYYRKYPEEQ